MRLRLKQSAGHLQTPVSKGDWHLERGRRTLGRSSECDWQIHDNTRSISKRHCTIERRMDGFVLHDESANGTNVDGRTVVAGESAGLHDGSRIVMGQFAFDVLVSGPALYGVGDPDERLRLSDEPLTISSILANVTPTGVGGHGILASDRQPADLPQSTTPRTQVTIGWEGPPPSEGLRPVLPDDWDQDSGLSSTLEHQAATRTHSPRLQVERPIVEKPDEIVPFATLNETPQIGAADLARIEAAIYRLEQMTTANEALFGLAPVDLPDEGSGISDEALIVRRLQEMEHRQASLMHAAERLFERAAELFDPARLETRTDARSRHLPGLAALTYWRAYHNQFSDKGQRLSVRDLLLHGGTSVEDNEKTQTRNEETDKPHEI
jgi:type VI secretion system protein ImpI